MSEITQLKKLMEATAEPLVEAEQSLQRQIRDIVVANGGTWEPGYSRAYKDRAPNGSISVKLDYVKLPKSKQAQNKMEAALKQAFPAASYVSASMGSVNISFDKDPGIGPKINSKAYNMRLATLKKQIDGLATSSGKSLKDILRDVSKIK